METVRCYGLISLSSPSPSFTAHLPTTLGDLCFGLLVAAVPIAVSCSVCPRCCSTGVGAKSWRSGWKPLGWVRLFCAPPEPSRSIVRPHLPTEGGWGVIRRCLEEASLSSAPESFHQIPSQDLAIPAPSDSNPRLSKDKMSFRRLSITRLEGVWNPREEMHFSSRRCQCLSVLERCVPLQAWKNRICDREISLCCGLGRTGFQKPICLSSSSLSASSHITLGRVLSEEGKDET